MNIFNYQYIFTVVYTILLLHLTGCNNNEMAANLGGQSSLQSNAYHTDNPTSYKGSEAYNNSLFGAEDVNGQTGTLTISKSLVTRSGITLDMDIDLNLIYFGSATSSEVFGLPKGWSYQLSYVIPGSLTNKMPSENSLSSKNTANTSVNIDGNNYLFDKSWHDNKLYFSGLRYINNHGIKFEQVSSRSLPWGNDNRKYFYLYTDGVGGHQYFDYYGKLLARDNRYGSHISYIYADLVGSVYNTHLTEINDSYNQKYFILQKGNTVTVVNNGKTLSTFNFDTTGVKTYTDAMGYVTRFFYNQDKLINKINYPSGLVTTFDYTTLPYRRCSGGNGYLFAVSHLTHYSTLNKLLN